MKIGETRISNKPVNSGLGIMDRCIWILWKIWIFSNFMRYKRRLAQCAQSKHTKNGWTNVTKMRPTFLHNTIRYMYTFWETTFLYLHAVFLCLAVPQTQNCSPFFDQNPFRQIYLVLGCNETVTTIHVFISDK